MTMYKIAHYGEPGSNTHIACKSYCPNWETVACSTFDDVLAAVSDESASLGMVPIENTLAGRVGDMHRLLPTSGLSIVGEHFLPIRLHLLGLKGAALDKLKSVHSHSHALEQCRGIIRKLALTPHASGDTASSAREVARWNDPTKASLATKLAAELYQLDVLAENVEDQAHNTTRFVVLSKTPRWIPQNHGATITSLVFRIRNVPAALYKVLGGFATNGVNMTRLESYMLDGEFTATQFLVDVSGHPDEPALARAIDELAFFSQGFEILGVYPAHPYRDECKGRRHSNDPLLRDILAAQLLPACAVPRNARTFEMDHAYPVITHDR
jgi:prephenate dehydratase